MIYFTKSFAARLLALGVIVLFTEISVVTGGIALTPFDPVVGLLLFGILLHRLYAGSLRLRLLVADPIIVMVFTLFAYVGAVNFYHGLSLIAVKELIQGTEYVLFALALAGVVSIRESWSAFIKTFLGITLVVTLFSVGYHISLGEFTSYKRLGAIKLLFGIPVLIGFAWYVVDRERSRDQQSWIILLTLLAYAIVLLLSAERKAYLGTAFGCATVWYAHQRMKAESRTLREMLHSVVRVAGIGMLGVAVIAILMQIPMVERQVTSLLQVRSVVDVIISGESSDQLQSSSQARAVIIATGLTLLAQNPIWGIGTDQFKLRIGQFLDSERLQLALHNEYLRYAVETGLVGLFVYLATYVVVLYQAWKLAKTTTGWRHSASLITLGLVVYGGIINAFLSGGALNHILLVLPAALVVGLSARSPDPSLRRGSAQAKPPASPSSVDTPS